VKRYAVSEEWLRMNMDYELGIELPKGWNKHEIPEGAVYLEPSEARLAKKHESLLERIRVKAMQTGWMQNLHDCLVDEINA
jgi:hypothetical protein